MTDTNENQVKELSPEDKREFAQKQLNFLTDKGFKNPRHRSRIFKAAGPGQVVAAYELYAQVVDNEAKGDILDCLLAGSGGAGSHDMPKERMEKVLETCGFVPPKANSTRAFYRILDGAMEMLVPNSFTFDDDEEKEIEEGLVRSRKKYEELAAKEEKE